MCVCVGGGGVHGVRSHPPPLPSTGPKGPHVGTQGPTFRVQSVKVKDGYIDNIFSLWNSNKQKINLFIEHANSSHLTNLRLKFQRMKLHYSTLQVIKGTIQKRSILDIRHITSLLKLNAHFNLDPPEQA